MVFKLQGRHNFMTKITIYNVQRARIPKVGKTQLLFLCSSPCFIVVNISVKFVKISQMVFKLNDRYDFVTDEQTSMANQYVSQSKVGRHNNNKKKSKFF